MGRFYVADFGNLPVPTRRAGRVRDQKRRDAFKPLRTQARTPVRVLDASVKASTPVRALDASVKASTKLNSPMAYSHSKALLFDFVVFTYISLHLNKPN